MPNWCSNTLNVSGNAEELEKFVTASQGLPAAYPPQEWEKGSNESHRQKNSFVSTHWCPPRRQSWIWAMMHMANCLRTSGTCFGRDIPSRKSMDITGVSRTGEQSGTYTTIISPLKKWGGLRAVSLSIFRLLRAGRRPRGGLKRSSSFTLSLRLNFTMKNPGAFLQASCMAKTVHFQ